MTRSPDEGRSPKVTVPLGGACYQSKGLLNVVLPGYITRSGKVFTLLLIERAWMYADPWSADRAWGFINTSVTVRWRLAYGRRYVSGFEGTAVKMAVPERDTRGGHIVSLNDVIVSARSSRRPEFGSRPGNHLG